MAKINILDKSVYNRIAAGEVVERPYSVVKELVENSVDAKADDIFINIVDGGKALIEVFDNGLGIEKEELLKTIMPHATSKISSTDDLNSIQTLGFRGEALPSIASVSQMRITSKTSISDIGYTFEVNGGEPTEIVESSCNNGTYVTVSNLFYNTPARQKFLKSTRSEENDVSDMVSRLILANPDIAFNYCVNDGTIFQSFGDGVEDALIAVYGANIIDNCFKISNYVHGVKIEGYIGKHNFTKPNRTYQTVILNGRYVVNSTIQSAIHNAYSSYLMKRQYPFYVLYITIPSEIVDVNVTPNKSDVRFVDNSVIYGALYSTISKVLDGTDTALNIISNNEVIFASPDVVKKQREIDNSNNYIKVVNRYGQEVKTYNYPKDDFGGKQSSNISVAEDSGVFDVEPQSQAQIKLGLDIFAENKRYIEELERKKREEEIKQLELEKNFELKYVGQVLNSYLIFEANGDMYIVDQHAAHERLLYNKILYLHSQKELTIQPLLVPFEITLNSQEVDFVERNLKYLNDLGFETTIDSENKLSIYTTPFELSDINMSEYFSLLFKDYTLHRETIPEIINEKLIQKACKSAVKAGMQLSKTQVDSLIRLLNGDINLKCPHGRPIAVRISRLEIDKWFKRVL